MKQVISLAFVLAIFIGYGHSVAAERPNAYDTPWTAIQAAKISDLEITRDIQARLKSDKTLSPDRVTVEVTNGEVIVRGNVNNKAEEIRIMNMALSTKGVK